MQSRRLFLSLETCLGEGWAELDEIVLNFEQGELEQVIGFLQDVRGKLDQLPADEQEHWHDRDESEEWSEGQPDLILFVEPNLDSHMR